LGAPLATLILVDPPVAVVIGVTVLGEPFPLTPARVVIAAFGLIVTTTGIWGLTHPPGQPIATEQTVG